MPDRPEIIYIHPAKQRVGFPFGDPGLTYLTPFTMMPVGIVGLMNMLRQDGFAVRGLNYPAESFADLGFDLRTWLQELDRPRLFLIDLHWYEHSFGALDVAQVCKQVHPRVPVLFGGLTSSLYAREILEGFPQVDYVIRGDAEGPLQQLAALICSGEGPAQSLREVPNLTHRVDGLVVENELTYRASAEDLDALDFASLDFLDHPRRYGGFQYVGRRDQFVPSEEPVYLGHWLSNGRGCIHHCSFCGGGEESHRVIAGRDGFVMRSIERVVDDMESLHARGIQQIALTLDPAVLGEDYWRPLFAELSRRKLRVGIYNEAFQLPSDEFVEAFAERVDLEYSQLALSLLSGDERVRRLNGKAYSNRDLFARLKTLRRHKVPLAIYYSFNLPGQNEASLRNTLFVSQRIARLYPARHLIMYNQPHTLDPCSPMSTDPERYEIDTELKTFQDYYRYCQHTAIENPGVRGIEDCGYRWRGRTRDEERKMQALWTSFGQAQKFLCF